MGSFVNENDLSLVVPDMKMQHNTAGGNMVYGNEDLGLGFLKEEPRSAPVGKAKPSLLRQASEKRKLAAQDGTLVPTRSRKRSTTLRSLHVVSVPSLEIGSGESSDDSDGSDSEEAEATSTNSASTASGFRSSKNIKATYTHQQHNSAHSDEDEIEEKADSDSHGPLPSRYMMHEQHHQQKSFPHPQMPSQQQHQHLQQQHQMGQAYMPAQELSLADIGRRSSTFTICNGMDTVFIGDEDDATPAYSRQGDDFGMDSAQDANDTEAQLSLLDLPLELEGPVAQNAWTSEADAMWAASQILAPNSAEEEADCNRALSDSALPSNIYNNNYGQHHQQQQQPMYHNQMPLQQQMPQQQMSMPPMPPMPPTDNMGYAPQPHVPHHVHHQQQQQQQLHYQHHQQQQQQQQQYNMHNTHLQTPRPAPSASTDAERMHMKMSPSVGHAVAPKERIGTRELSASKICFRRLWTPEEDALLISLVNKYGLGHWSDISQHFHNTKSPNQCSQRWHKALDPSIKKGKWTKEEDDALVKAVEQCGKHWREIARRIPGRTGKQCRDRYTSRLDPSIQNDAPWTPIEEQTILEAHKRLGNKWAAIQRLVPHRSWYSVKWRISILRKQEAGNA